MKRCVNAGTGVKFSVTPPVQRVASLYVCIFWMSVTGTHASPNGRCAVALRGLPFIALPRRAVQLLPACSSAMVFRVSIDRPSIVHLSVGRKVRFTRKFPFFK